MKKIVALTFSLLFVSTFCSALKYQIILNWQPDQLIQAHFFYEKNKPIGGPEYYLSEVAYAGYEDLKINLGAFLEKKYSGKESSLEESLEELKNEFKADYIVKGFNETCKSTKAGTEESTLLIVIEPVAPLIKIMEGPMYGGVQVTNINYDGFKISYAKRVSDDKIEPFFTDYMTLFGYRMGNAKSVPEAYAYNIGRKLGEVFDKKKMNDMNAAKKPNPSGHRAIQGGIKTNRLDFFKGAKNVGVKIEYQGMSINYNEPFENESKFIEAMSKRNKNYEEKWNRIKEEEFEQALLGGMRIGSDFKVVFSKSKTDYQVLVNVDYIFFGNNGTVAATVKFKDKNQEDYTLVIELGQTGTVADKRSLVGGVKLGQYGENTVGFENIGIQIGETIFFTQGGEKKGRQVERFF